ncbi:MULTISPECIES: hypothetical protein [Methylobacterium]|jgi:hypothetical protein|uniref:Uncharacterized protein n=1 Tax=Methylobacterium dankookense TaxID=560405 RepID=A0A564FW29_9HYPH|nr:MULTISPECIES: hypothetical protein [Methylobacterium]GJD54990.1 hypothetical protein IFDJLNFL_0872 [Methylobacterium dankookense]VUF11988.1 hypothetical protein MTDSW087_01676 [Methylobacterium dankookense]
MARPPLPAHDLDAHRAWVAETVAAPFRRPRELARLVHSKAEKPPAPERPRDLFDMMEAPQSSVPAPEPEPAARDDGSPWYVKQGLPIDEVLRHHFGAAISPPSPLALKRARLKRERAEAAIAARAAAQAAAVEDEKEDEEEKAETPAPEPTPEPEAPPAAGEAGPAPAAAPALALTFDMGFWTKAHAEDRIEFEPALGKPHRVACPPFHLHDEERAEPIDEFLGQVVGVEHGRALLFRRRDPDVMDGCEVGQRYILMRFWRDDTGEVWSMPVRGDDADAVRVAIWRTVNLYRRNRGGSG